MGSHAPEIHPATAELLGIPFEAGGSDFRPSVGGADCKSLVLEFLRRIGVEAQDPWDVVAAQWHAEHELATTAPSAGRWVAVEDGLPQAGDVGETSDAGHVCVCVGGGYALHAVRDSASCLLPLHRSRAQRWWRWGS